MRFCWLFLLSSIVLTGYETSAQNYPTYDGYFINPFIYNPAAAATDQLQINAGYRRQWFGIPGAPSISSLTATSLIDQTRAGIGFKVSTFSRGFLNSTDASIAYAYGVPLSKVNKLFFGLSGGLLSNTVNLGEITSVSDPALANVSNSLVPSASFGILFKSSNGLNLGFTLPKLINVDNLDAKYSFSYFDNAIVTASFSKWQPTQPVKKGRGRSYKSKKSANVPLELFSIYRYSSYGGLFEATGKFNFNSNIWLSATYRQYAGIIPGIGISLENFTFSYFYEPGLGGDLPLKTHEVLLSIHLGKAKKFRDKAPTPPAAKVTTNQPKVVAKKTEPVKKVEEPKKKVEEKKIEPVVVVTPIVAQKEEKKEPIKKVEEPKKTEPKKVEEKKTEPAAIVPIIAQKEEKKEPDVTHQPRFKRTDPIAKIDNVSDTAAIKKAHLEERKELEKHIEEHAEGKHDDRHNEPINERHDFVKRGTHHEEIEVGTYVIAGAFQSRDNAEHYVKTLKSLGYKDSDFGHLSVRNLWYVFIAEDTDIPKARIQRNKLQKNRIFKDVWLLTVQE